MKTTHTILTANDNIKERALRAASWFGMVARYRHKSTCIKKHSIEIEAVTPGQIHVLDTIILASTAHPEQQKYIDKLNDMVNDQIKIKKSELF